MEINVEGTRHLGAAVGGVDFKHAFLRRKIDTWIGCVRKLALTAATEPHAAFAAFTQSLQGR